MEHNLKRYKKRRQPQTFNIIVNKEAAEYSSDGVDFLIKRLEDAGARYFFAQPDSSRSTVAYTKKILNKKPDGIIVCGGDGTVNLVARSLIRRKTILGIVPMGQYNNIYRSLYGGKADIKNAVDNILTGKYRKIDYAVASGNFFLGALAVGFVPRLHDILMRKRNPRFGIGWSRLAAQAAANTPVKDVSIKVDAFAFDLAPRVLNINLLPDILGLKFAPACIDSDGKCEITFDTGDGSAIISSYIRNIFKGKYVYADNIRMYRGEKISVSPMEGRKVFIDGDVIEWPAREMTIETYSERLKIFQKY